jgi:tyrosine-protein kinase Etk/Wzc
VNEVDEITLRDVYLILRRHLALVLGLPILFALVAAGWAFFLTPSSYRAEATLVVTQPQLTSKLEEKIESLTPPAFSSDELSRIANSQEVLTATLKAIRELETVTAEWRNPNFTPGDLDGRLNVSFATPASLGSQANQSAPNPLVILQVDAPDGPTAGATANAWADATRQVINRMPQQRLQGQLDTVTSALTAADERLEKAENEYQRFQASSNLEADESQLRAVIEALGEEAAAATAGGSAAAQARVTALRARVNALRGPVAQATVDEERYYNAWREAIAEREALSKKLSDLRIELASADRLAQTLVPAFAPTRPEPRNSGVKIALALVLGLMLGLILPFIIEAVRDPQAAGASGAQARGRAGNPAG